MDLRLGTVEGYHCRPLISTLTTEIYHKHLSLRISSPLGTESALGARCCRGDLIVPQSFLHPWWSRSLLPPYLGFKVHKEEIIVPLLFLRNNALPWRTCSPHPHILGMISCSQGIRLCLRALGKLCMKRKNTHRIIFVLGCFTEQGRQPDTY
jgi:hypothetical protein